MSRQILLVILCMSLTSCSAEREEPATAPQQSTLALRMIKGRFATLTESIARESYRLKNWLSALGQKHAYEMNGDSWFTSSLSGKFAKSRSGKVHGKTHSTFGKFSALSDLGSGIKYDVNQDGYLIFNDPKRLVLGVFDGSSTGGSGEIATQVGINTMRRYLPRKSLQDSLLSVRNELYLHASVDRSVSRQYSAVVAGVEIAGNTANIAHAGDVRVLHMRNRELLFHTNDHNRAWREVMEGRMTQEDYLSPKVDKSGADRDLRIPRGGDAGKEIVEATQRQLVSGDMVVIASDGVWKSLTIDEVAALTHGRSPKEAAAAIRKEVKSRVKLVPEVDDNITVVVYRHDPEGLL